jgi:NADP-dependent 3-hydroxy acid dehydrogenase YdfG
MDVVVVSAALWQFQQTVLLEHVSKANRAAGTAPHIIVIGSTTDRVKNGKAWLYNAEKKALRDFSNTLAIGGVWTEGLPKVSYISFGTLSNNQEKHPDRKCMDIDEAAGYIKWLINQPKYVNINEISIDPMQGINND